MKSLETAMKFFRGMTPFLMAAVCCLSLSACSGDTPVRYTPTVPDKPAGVVASAGDRQVSLAWNPSSGAGGYRVYYGTAPGVTTATGTIVNVPGTSSTVTGLANDTTYYFVVTALVASGESFPSAEVSATPASPGPYVQHDLEGVWNFSILVSGASPGWMRGTITVGSAGAVSFNLYQDSSGGAAAPAALFPALLLNPAGEVRDSSGNLPGFRGAIATNRALVVGNGPWTGSGRYLAILQKQLPITFLPADLQGFGGTGGGGRRFIYHQISAGTGAEWEWASGQIGRDQKVQYPAITAPSNPALPGDKATILNISSEGVVTESLAGAAPVPALVMDRAVMSADKTLVAGVATDSSHAAPRYVLRIYQMINIVPNDPNTFAAGDLAGSYQFQKLVSGTASVTASGTLSVDPSGSASYGSYADSAGVTAAPGFTMVSGSDGMVTDAADPSLHGKLSYFKDLLVLTRSEGSGNFSMNIGLKQ